MIIISVKEWYEEEGRDSLGNDNYVMLKDLPIKHLSGQHDQQSHGRGGIGISRGDREFVKDGFFKKSNGDAILFYHGTEQMFDSFDDSKIGTGADKGGKNWYGSGHYLSGEEWKGRSYAAAAGVQGILLTVITRVKSPFIVSGTAAGKLDIALERSAIDLNLRGKDLTIALQKKGYDSILVLKDNGKDYNELVVFKSGDLRVIKRDSLKRNNTVWWDTRVSGGIPPGGIYPSISKVFPGKYDQDRIRVGLSAIFKGGAGSGHFGHSGREGQVGGSNAAGGEGSLRERKEGEVLPDHIAGLRIPPAWTNVRYNPDPAAALWVKGYDSKGRMQSIYSPEFTRQQADAKWARIAELDKKIGEIRKQNVKALEDIKTKESAACLQLIMAAGIRPGSERDTKAKVKAYGATTLEGRHVKKQGDAIVLEFVGKKGVQLSILVDDRNLGNALFKRAETVGKNDKLFKVSSDQLLTYVDSLDGGKFTTKDFRTYLGTKLAVGEVKKYGDKKPRSIKEYKKFVKDVATMVSRKLGNTPTVALQSYINPTVFARWQGEF